jgi:hypothetical protein
MQTVQKFMEGGVFLQSGVGSYKYIKAIQRRGKNKNILR